MATSGSAEPNAFEALKLVVERTADAILRYDRDARLLYVSPGCRHYGYEPDDLVGRSGLELIHPDDVDRMRASIAELFSGAPVDEGRDRQYRVRTKSGDWVWIESNPTVVRDEQGRPIEVVVVQRDISERRAAAEALSASEARYRIIAESATDIISRTSITGRFIYVSPSVTAITGYTPEELNSRSLIPFIHPEDVETCLALYRGLIAGHKADKTLLRYRTRHKQGHWVWLECNPSLVRDANGEPMEFVDVTRDATAAASLEAQLREARDAAQAATLAKSQFLANMSHEIRNPLAVVLGYGELLEKLAGQSEQARTYIGRINTGARTLLEIVDDVLDFSKLEAGKIELDPQAFELTAFLNETVEQFLTAATNRGLDLRIEQRGELPAIVRADRRRLQEVLSNLITNALKFTGRGSVTVAVGYEPGRLKFEVTDTGIGVSAQDAGRLFERFSQIDASNTRTVGGSGLGLAIAKGLVEVMGGEIGVVSEPGQGSTFWFNIKARAEKKRAAPKRPPIVAWDLEPLSLLMAEDVAVNRELVSDMLGPYGIEITGAADGVEAVEAALGARFDLILMDVQMPRLDGLAATQAIRANSDVNRDTPIVALSANVVQAQVDACLQAGMNDYIRKPIDMAELLTKIARWTRDAEVASAARSPVTPEP